MIESKFLIDLGQGDFMEVTIQSKEGYSLNNIIDDVKKADEWVIFNDSALQKSHIKRIVSLKQ